MTILAISRWAWGVPVAVAVFLTWAPTVAVAAPTMGQLAMQCDDAFRAQRWADIVDICKNLAANSGDVLTHKNDLSETDKLSMYELIVLSYLRVAHAQIELGDLEQAKVDNDLALLWLTMARTYGMSTESSKYQSLKSLITGQAAELSPP